MLPGVASWLAAAEADAGSGCESGHGVLDGGSSGRGRPEGGGDVERNRTHVKRCEPNRRREYLKVQ